MSAPICNLTCGIFAASLLAGCATLGGNVQGNFACRAPEGTCAPTSLIDAQATGVAAGQEAKAVPSSVPSGTSVGRSLRIVLAAHRDEAGREHEARVVEVVLPEPAAEGWRQPSGTGELLRAIGQSVAGAPEPENSQNPNLPELPDQLFLPSQPGPAIPGAHAPDPGAPGRNASPGRVPHPLVQPAPEQGDQQ